MDSEYLFVYGTLLNDIDNDMSRFLSSNSEFVESGFFNGRLYHISWYPGAILSDNTTEKVIGKVYKIYNTEDTFKVLDDYEGIGSDNPKPYLYRRELVTVYLDNAQEIKSWVYIYDLPVERLKQIESGDFLNP